MGFFSQNANMFNPVTDAEKHNLYTGLVDLAEGLAEMQACIFSEMDDLKQLVAEVTDVKQQLESLQYEVRQLQHR